MAQGARIETRIALQGGDEVRRKLEEIGKAGEKAMADIGKRAGDVGKSFSAADEVRKHLTTLGDAGEKAGNQVRASLLAATSQLGSFSTGARASVATSGQMGFALQNLTFQVNDVATSLASGGDAFRVFAQQGGQIVQVFQQGGGVAPVLRAAGSAITGLITPMRLAAAGAVALGAAFADIVSIAADSQASARKFDVTLRAMGKSGQLSGKELEAAAQRLRDVGLSADEAREQLQSLLVAGARLSDLERIVRIGQDVRGAFGEDAAKQFLAAAGQGGEALQQFAEKFGLIPKGAAEAESALKKFADETQKASQQINQSIFDEQQRAAQQIADLTREKGTAQFEIERASQQRIADLLTQRNRDNARRLAEFNKQIEESAQKAAGSGSLLDQIEQRVGGSFARSLTPLRKAFLDLGVQWREFLNAMAGSKLVQTTLETLRFAVVGLVGGLAALTKNIKEGGGWGAFAVAAAAAVPVIVGLGVAFAALGAVIAPVATGLLAIAGAVSWPAVLLAGVVALTAAFVDWSTLWSNLTGTVQAFLNLMVALGTYISNQFVQLVIGAWETIKSGWSAVTTWIGEQWTAAVNLVISTLDPLVQWFSDTWIAIKDGFDSLVKWMGDQINGLLGWFNDLIQRARQVASAIGDIFSRSGGGSVTPTATFAGGGVVRGPGSSMSDSILARLSDGEFVMRTRAVEHWGVGVMAALNRLQNPFEGFALGGLADAMTRPLVPRTRFATGGLVGAGAGGGGAPVNIHIGGGVFPLRGEVDVVGEMAKAARRAGILSAGRL